MTQQEAYLEMMRSLGFDPTGAALPMTAPTGPGEDIAAQKMAQGLGAGGIAPVMPAPMPNPGEMISQQKLGQGYGTPAPTPAGMPGASTSIPAGLNSGSQWPGPRWGGNPWGLQANSGQSFQPTLGTQLGTGIASQKMASGLGGGAAANGMLPAPQIRGGGQAPMAGGMRGGRRGGFGGNQRIG